MQLGTLRALEFDRVASVVRGLAVTPTGDDRLAELHPSIDAAEISALQRATTEGVRFLADRPGFPLRAHTELNEILDALAVDGRALENDSCVGGRRMVDYVIEHLGESVFTYLDYVIRCCC